MSAAQITDADFTNLTASGFALVDFWAPWCQPCKQMAPFVDELAQAYPADKLKVMKADIEVAPQAARKAAVRSVPSFALMKDGKVVSMKSGSMSKSALFDWVASNLQAA